MEHNTNQNSNYLALLNLADDGTYTVTKIEIIGSDKFVYIEKNLKPINVNLKMYSFDHLRMYNIDHINTCCSRW